MMAPLCIMSSRRVLSSRDRIDSRAYLLREPILLRLQASCIIMFRIAELPQAARGHDTVKEPDIGQDKQLLRLIARVSLERNRHTPLYTLFATLL